MKLALGTVQFGLNYGVANTSGRPDTSMVGQILERAKSAGIDLLDTAIGYGNAEQVLGTQLRGDEDETWQIVTKLPALPDDLAPHDVRDWVGQNVTEALSRLHQSSVAGLLLHNAGDLLSPNGPELVAALLDEKRLGRVLALGISIYGPDDLDRLLDHGGGAIALPLDIVQAPANVLDRRLEISGWADRLQASGCRIHLRSAFLQGLLLMPASARPERFQYTGEAGAPLRAWDDWLSVSGEDPLAASLRFALSRPYADRVIIGVDSLTHLDQIISAARSTGSSPPAQLATTQKNLLDPREWT